MTRCNADAVTGAVTAGLDPSVKILTIAGSGTIALDPDATNNAPATTTVNVASGTLLLQSPTAIPSTANVVVGAAGTLELNGMSLSVNSLAGYGTVDNNIFGAVPMLTITGGNQTFAGNLTVNTSLSARMALTYAGSGTLTLVGAGSNYGSSPAVVRTTIHSGGTIAIESNNCVGNGAVLVQSGAELVSGRRRGRHDRQLFQSAQHDIRHGSPQRRGAVQRQWVQHRDRPDHVGGSRDDGRRRRFGAFSCGIDQH